MLSLHWNVVYGPVQSRRLGRSLGVNLLPPDRKICSFNCAYCQYGWSRLEAGGQLPPASQWPAREQVARAVERELRQLRTQGESLDRLTLAGHGEPTLHPEFPGIVRDLRALRDKLAPDLPIAILSNSGTLDRAPVRKALAELDERYMKLDAGDEGTRRRLNGSPVEVGQLVAGLKGLADIFVQAMFVGDRQGRLDNTGQETVSNWLAWLAEIRPRGVHLYTIDRQPAFPFLRAVPLDRLDAIAQRVREVGIPALTFP